MLLIESMRLMELIDGSNDEVRVACGFTMPTTRSLLALFVPCAIFALRKMLFYVAVAALRVLLMPDLPNFASAATSATEGRHSEPVSQSRAPAVVQGLPL